MDLIKRLELLRDGKAAALEGLCWREFAGEVLGALADIPNRYSWVPVGTPPEEGAHVLVLHENGDIQDAYRRYTWAGGFTTARDPDSGGRSVEQVTHWMPLPEAPKC